MDPNFNYIEEANVTMADGIHKELMDHDVALEYLQDTIETLGKLDKLKKLLFYGRQNDLPNYPIQRELDVSMLDPNYSKAVRIFHGVLGIATEAGEMLEQVVKAMKTNNFDGINLAEEVGDNQWYAAAILRALGKTFDEVQVTNIAKLRARFPNAFTEFDANNRNLDVERAILEKQAITSKPTVQIKDYAILGPEGAQFLVGKVMDHPRAPPGLWTDVRTSTIVNRVGDLVETRNTIYALQGDPVA